MYMDNQKDQNQSPVESTTQAKQVYISPFSKYLPLIIVALIAALLGSTGTYLALKQPNTQPQNILQNTIIPSPTPIPDETANPDSIGANWKTYTNQKYGYSIMYPDTWITNETDLNNINILGMGKGSNNGFAYGGQSVIINVASTNLTNQEYIKTNIAPTSNPIKIESININGILGEKWTFNTDNNSDNYAVFFNRNEKTYVLIKESNNNSQFKEYNAEVNKVISTFKFTAAEESIEFNGRKLLIKRVPAGEYCEGRVSRSQTEYKKCQLGLKCEQPNGSAADAPGICIKE